MRRQRSERVLTQEQLDHLLHMIDWQAVAGVPDRQRAAEGKEHLMKRIQKLQVHWQHVRIWRRACCSALAVAVFIGWILGPLPLGIAIRATARLPTGVRLLQETQMEAGAEEPWLRQAWDCVIALVTPASRAAAVTAARWDPATGLIRAAVRGTDGYVLVDPHASTLVGIVGTEVPGGSQQEKSALPLFDRLELARKIALADPAVQKTHRQAVAVSPLTAYYLASADRTWSYALSTQKSRSPQEGTFVAVQLQRPGGREPELTAIVNTVERRVVQIVNTDQVYGMVVVGVAGSYAVIESQAH